MYWSLRHGRIQILDQSSGTKNILNHIFFIFDFLLFFLKLLFFSVFNFDSSFVNGDFLLSSFLSCNSCFCLFFMKSHFYSIWHSSLYFFLYHNHIIIIGFHDSNIGPLVNVNMWSSSTIHLDKIFSRDIHVLLTLILFLYYLHL